MGREAISTAAGGSFPRWRSGKDGQGPRGWALPPPAQEPPTGYGLIWVAPGDQAQLRVRSPLMVQVDTVQPWDLALAELYSSQLPTPVAPAVVKSSGVTSDRVHQVLPWCPCRSGSFCDLVCSQHSCLQ